ncbi:hypothetical protein TWF481_001940 [Arthrobotrys musiformis]|uniref:Nephrocystin 3-like N-terminal domain-containing protein n=1 Tax=Arthrobotrys musiformis TaxID=47236 RepID=A0AAV9W0U1_9PEZI
MLKRELGSQGLGGEPSSRVTTSPIPLNQYTIGWICALSLEMAAAKAMLDLIHVEAPRIPNDDNSYVLGSIASHMIVVACLPAGGYGTVNATAVAAQMSASFPYIKYYLMVGIAGGVPRPSSNGTHDIRLGDIVVSTPVGDLPGVVKYDSGKTIAGGRFVRVGVLDKPPRALLNAVNKLQADHITKGSSIPNLILDAIRRYPKLKDRFTYPGVHQDRLFHWEYDHIEGNMCENCDEGRLERRDPRPDPGPQIYYGIIASGDQLIKHGRAREKLAQDIGIHCIEMEAGGLMDAFPCLVIRGICDYADSHKNKQWQEYSAAVAAAYAKEILSSALPGGLELVSDPDVTNGDVLGPPCVGLGTRPGKLQLTGPKLAPELEPKNYAEKLQAELLRSLEFRGIDSRRNNIDKPIQDTCDWIFESHVFKKWQQRQALQECNGVLWIKGKPGAGKSTLMKHVLMKRDQLFPDNLIGSYFFSARGTGELERSFLGMLRSWIYRILRQDSQLCWDLIIRISREQRIDDLGGREWEKHELKEALWDIISEARRPVVLLVDALDECHEAEVRAVVAYLEELSSAAVKSGYNLNICVSSRHYPSITMRKNLELVVESHSSHSRDISIYVEEKLRPNVQQIKDGLCARAQGIFMWVVLVVEILNRAFDEGDMIAVEQKLKEIPNDLEKVFSSLLEDGNRHKEETILLFQWQLFAEDEMSYKDLYYAVIAGTQADSLNPQGPIIAGEVIKRFITSNSKGLIEVVPGAEYSLLRNLGRNPDKAQFIHETVRDFLLRNQRLETLDPSLKGQVFRESHKRLAGCCLKSLAMSESRLKPWNLERLATTVSYNTKWGELCPFPDDVLGTCFPFLDYSALNILHHLRHSEAEGTDLQPFLSTLLDSGILSFVYELTAHSDQHMRLPERLDAFLSRSANPTKARLLWLLSWFDCVRPVRALLSSQVKVGSNEMKGVEPIHADYRRTLVFAVENAIVYQRSIEIVRLLIDSGADLNTPTHSISSESLVTPLETAVISLPLNVIDDEASASIATTIIKMLVDAGADVNLQRPSGNLLQFCIAKRCCTRGYFAIIRTLIDLGADVKAEGGGYKNALDALYGIPGCGEWGCAINRKRLAQILIRAM